MSTLHQQLVHNLIYYHQIIFTIILSHKKLSSVATSNVLYWRVGGCSDGPVRADALACRSARDHGSGRAGRYHSQSTDQPLSISSLTLCLCYERFRKINREWILHQKSNFKTYFSAPCDCGRGGSSLHVLVNDLTCEHETLCAGICWYDCDGDGGTPADKEPFEPSHNNLLF